MNPVLIHIPSWFLLALPGLLVYPLSIEFLFLSAFSFSGSLFSFWGSSFPSPLYLDVSFAYNTHLQVTLKNQKMRTKGARKFLARTAPSLRTGPYVCKYIVMEKEHSKRKTGQRVFMHNVPWFTIETPAGGPDSNILIHVHGLFYSNRQNEFFFVLATRQSELIPPPVPHIRL